MKSKFLVALIPVLLLAVSAWRLSQPSGQRVHAGVATASTPAAVLESAVMQSYVPFDMENAFVRPAGPKGLDYEAETRRLEGKKVRVAGSMVRHLHDDAAVFLLTSRPMTLNMAEYGLADDLPPHAVHVILTVLPGMAPEWVRQPLVVFGTLQLGSRTELDGRVSHLRLLADHVTAADGRTLIEPRRSVLLQPSRIQSGKVKLETLSARSVE